ncbi:uncharacterized protein MONOS_17142 [Monocercomonoides exilis]|uniref:uncharacterized protein n=1 Tax=Monocercomonoides exilis TaxID=2049356 RepID=UPI0035597CE7|nr:hypothetical protein MONOS_17142 [Monocercomonoides exilis]
MEKKWGGDVIFFKCREREEGSYEAEQEGEFLLMYDRLAAPGDCRASDGGGCGGRQEEGTSALALCIGGVEAEEDEELIMGGVLQWKETEKGWRYLYFFGWKKGNGSWGDRDCDI